jgi:hypothetical protein
LGWDGVSQMIFDGPATHLGAVELKGVKKEGLELQLQTAIEIHPQSVFFACTHWIFPFS